MNKIGIILICTGKYDQFLKPLIDSIDKYFFTGQNIDICIFSDKDPVLPEYDRLYIYQMDVPHLPFPFPTLFRYKWITEFSHWLTAENLYYMDVDMLVVNHVGEEIIPNRDCLVATRHPGFHVNHGWGDHKTNTLSTAYVAPSERHDYYAGGFQGGSRNAFLTASKIMAENIETDLKNNIIAQWADESHWNKYLKTADYIELSPAYCMVEQVALRRCWGVDEITPLILALEKDHAKLRD